MKKMYSLLLSMTMAMLLSSLSWAQCIFQTQTFDANPILAASDVNGAWYPDRYAPNGFTADAGRLKISIRPGDGAQARPPAFLGAFYNTQGRKFNQCGTCVTLLKGDLYIPSDWATNKRSTSMWATAYDISNTISFYPILGFRNVNGSTPTFFYWNGAGSTNLATTVVYDTWVTLEIKLLGTDVVYSINGSTVATVPSGGSTYLGNIIMQAYNFNDTRLDGTFEGRLEVYDAGNSYDAFWDNLVITVPRVTNTNTGEQFCTIQAAIDDADTQNGHTITAAPGTYNENVTVNKSITLRSTAGSASTTITGSTGTLGTLLIQADNVTIGGFGQGFTINGYDNSDPGIEVAAVYVQGVRNNITIRGNNIVANGEAGLLTEFGQAVNNLVLNANTFSGKTFTGAEAGDCGFANQFTAANVPRQLVNIATGTGITFTSNNITGIAGSTSSVPVCATFGQGNTLVTIDANNATIRGNTFAGTTTRFGSSLRARGTGANIACNTFSNTGLGAACPHIVLNAGSLASGSPNSLAGIASQNTFNEGAYFNFPGANQIYRDAAQVIALAQTPIAVNTTVLANVTNTNTGEKFCSIQAAIDDANTINGHTISVAAGTYNEDVVVNKSLTINGAGIDVSTVVGPIGGGGATFLIAANGVVINGFTITRAGNNTTDWNNSGLNTAGISIQSQGNTAEIKNNKIIGNRTGIDVNNSNGNNIHNNLITFNRTGLIFRNQTDNTTLIQNEITDNWTVGVLFLDASGGSNSPVQTAASSSFNNNKITGNWYGGVVDRQSGGSLPTPGSNLKNFSCNWYGSTSPAVSTMNSSEPGYSGLIPVLYGGAATNPGGSPDIAGAASANISFILFLVNGTDNDAGVIGFQPVPNSCLGCIGGVSVQNTNTGEYFCSIQAAIDDAQTLAGHTITVAAGTYNEDVVVNKSLTINGAGIDVSTVVGPIGGGGATFLIAANGVVINGFTITRAGNNTTDWNNSGLNTAGISIQSQGNTAEIKNNKIIGNRTGIDVNNSNGNNIHNNIITFNRTGLIFRNQTDNTALIQNTITDNWTVGVLFLDASGGSNSPIQTASNSTFNNNNISGNWYGNVVDRQTGGSLPTPGNNLKNFSCNWYGSTSPAVSTMNSSEPGYAMQIPVAYGGVATNPGGAPDIAGAASANISYILFLVNGTDNEAGTIGFQPVPNSCSGCVGGVSVQNTTTGEYFCSIQAAIDDAQTLTGHTITVSAGTYNENVNVTKSLTITGAGKGNNPATNTVLSASTACVGVGITVAAADVTISNMYLTGYLTGVLLNGVTNPKLNDLTIVDYCLYGVNLGGSNQNIEIKQSTIQRTTPLAGTVGVRAGTANAVNGLLIDGCTINGNTQGMNVAQNTTPVAFDNITIQNSTISNNTQKGLYFEKLSNALLSNLTMDNNGTDATYGFNNGIDINLKYSSYSNITIQNCDITNSGATGMATDPQTPAAITIKARDDASSYNTIPASLSGVILQNNKITGPTNGIRFGEFGKINATPTNITLQNNDLSHPFTGKAVISRINGNIDMKCNWHGTTDVATIQSTFTTAGSGVINLITYLTSGTDNAQAVGFQPTPGSCTGCPNFVPTITVTETSGTTPDDGIICNGASITLTASQGSSYLWNTNAATQGITVSPSTTTLYTVTVTDANNCVAIASTTVTVNAIPPTPTITAGGPTTFCSGSSVILTSSSASGNQWYLNGNPIGGATNQTYSATAAGSYTLLVTSLGCPSSPSIATTVTINPQPVGPTLNAKTPNIPTICAGTAVIATFNLGSGGVGCSDDYTVSIDGGPAVAYTQGSLVGSNATNSIVIQGRRANCSASSGCNGTDYVTLASWNVSPQPVGPTLLAKTPNLSAVCLGTGVSATFNAGSGGVGCSDDFTLSIDGGTPVAYTPGSTVGANATSSIVIQGRRANCSPQTGCNGTNYVTLAAWSVNPQPVGPTLLAKTPNIPAICFGTGVSATFNAGSGGVGCADNFTLSIDGGPAVAYTPGSTVGASATTSIVIQGRRAGCSAGAGCNGTSYVTLASWSVSPQPVGPTLLAKTPNAAAICFGTGVSATFNAGSGGVGCSDDYTVSIDGGPAVAYTPGSSVGATATSSILIQGRRANCTTDAGCNGTNYVTLASWSVNPLPTATIAGTTVVCQNAPFPQITFTGSGGTAPYTFTYKINGGLDLTIVSIGNTATLSQTTAMAGIFNYTLVSVKDASSTQCSQNQGGSATITVNAPPSLGSTPASLCTGQTLTLSPNTGGTWQSSNPSIAGVTPAGFVTAVAAGVVYFTFTETLTGCSAKTADVIIKQTPTSNLTASKVDVCPNTEVTLNANCSIPTSTIQWNPGGPTVTPAAATLPYVYKASCTADGCTGNESSVEVRTHRILVDMKDLDVGALPLPIVRAVKDNMAPTNLIQAPSFPRRWTFIANGCDASESAEFKLSGPVIFNTIDNASTYAMFANDAGGFYSLDHPNYGNGGSFPNGIYTLTINLRNLDGVGGPFPKNRVPVGALVATRTLEFTVGNPSLRQGVGELAAEITEENWISLLQNPVSEEIMVRLSGKVGEEIELALVNLQGQSIQQRGLKLSSVQQSEVLHIRNAPSGLYILKAIKGDKVKTMKVVKVD